MFKSLNPIDVVWTGSRFVAVATGLVLLSDDGLTWRRGAVLSVDGGAGRVAISPRGLVAIGQNAPHVPMVWTSSDGEVWRAAPRTAAFAAPSGREIGLSGVAATADGWVIVGAEGPVWDGSPANDLLTTAAAAWTSTNGRDWTRAPTSAALRPAQMNDVAVVGERIVAVGSIPSGERYQAMAWVSDDGVAWTRATDTGSFGATDSRTLGAVMTSVAARGSVIVAGGVMPGDPGWSAMAWWSADGRTWWRAAGEAMAYGQVVDIAVMPSGFLMSGPSPASSCNGVRSTADGRSWTCAGRTPALDGFAAYASASSGQVEVLVGLEGVDDGSNGVVWIREAR